METKKKTVWRRRNYLIHPRFQLTIVLVNVICTLLCFAGVCIAVERFFDDMMKLGAAAGFPDNHAYYRYVDMQLGSLGPKLLLVFVISTVGSSLLSIWISHKAVGPIYKLTNHFRLLLQAPAGQPKPVLRFRQNDLFSELPELVNRVVGARSDED